MVTYRGKSLKEQLKTLFELTGHVYNHRVNIGLNPTLCRAIGEKIASDVQKFFAKPVQRQVRTDGLKLIFEDGSWVLMRPSGTETVVRYYAESKSRAELAHLLEFGRQWITEV